MALDPNMPLGPGNRLGGVRRPLRRRVHSLLVKRMVPPGGGPGAPGPGAPGAPGAVDPYDYSADPTLQRIKALGAQRLGSSEADALQARKQLAIDYGDPSLAPDEATRAAATANPNSIMAGLARDRTEKPRQLTNTLSAQNLGYSGAGLKQQSELVRSLQANQAEAQGQVRSRLGDIESTLQNARLGVQQDEIGAQEDAAARMRQRLGDLPLGAAPGGAPHGIPIGGPVRSALVQRLHRPRRPRPIRAPVAGRLPE